MDDQALRRPHISGQFLRLSTLVSLRWLAVVGQTAAVLVVGLWFEFPIPWTACFALIGMSALLNIVLRLTFRSSRQLDPNWAATMLGYDLLQLAGLLYLTGGLQNPFAILLLGPVMASATTLQPDKTFLLGAMAFAAATMLLFAHRPLPWFVGESFSPPLHYVGGVWVAMACALPFMAFYAFRVAEEARQLANALSATELVLQREQHLSALDGLAAAAAHELGTPLATISLVANEMERELAPGDPRAEDIRLLRTQSQRCRDILSKIASLSAAPAEHLERVKLSHLMEDIVAPHRDFGIAIQMRVGGSGSEPVLSSNPGIVHGLGNLVENAVDFAGGQATVKAAWTEDSVKVEVSDDGPGFSPEILDRMGEPYVTTRRSDGTDVEHGGLGLGVFIAKTFLERSGARIAFGNRRAPDTGAVVTITWPRARFEESREPGQGNEDVRRVT